MKPAGWTPTLALADGLAAHVRQWSLQLGATEAAADVASSAAGAVSRATAEGHVCVPIARLGPDVAALRRDLLASRVVAEPGQAAQPLPLVLDAAGRLYLHRHFDFEQRLARRLRQAVASGPEGLAIVSGGPGTGKTTRIVGELARLLQAEPALRIALAAPTGKAAARMTEALRERAGAQTPAVRERLPVEAFTVHRLLRYGAGRGFEHHAGNPLALDVLVVDEASMLDLALATRLLEAVPPHARVMLLGDRDQLAAVESGAVFAELSAQEGRLPVTVLTQNWRFPEDSGIGRLAAEIRRGDAAAAIAGLRARSDPAVRWEPAAPPLALAQAGYAPMLEALRHAPADVAAVARAFAGFRVLCAVREGPQGADTLNRELAGWARRELGAEGPGEWYPGRPVMVRVNDYAMRLFNGDVGIVLPGQDGQLQAWFPEGEGWRPVAASRVPRHETAYAMTVHQAQGSEFDEVLLVLPTAGSRVATRELAYTGVTRARSRVLLCAAEPALTAAIEARTERDGGLRDRLREAFEQP